MARKVAGGVCALIAGIWGAALVCGQVSLGATPTRVIAAWDVVPYQVFDTPFHAGVVAFHETGCTVQFTVCSGVGEKKTEMKEASRTVRAPTLNPQTNVWEYWIPLDPKRLPDGPVEVQARCMPLGESHIATDLPPLMLYANAGRSLSFGAPVWVDCEKGDDGAGDGSETQPLRTIAAAVRKVPAGGTVYLKPGKDYSADRLGGGKSRPFWTTIAAAPGAKREDVEIGPGRPGTDKLRFFNVTLYADPPRRMYHTILAGENGSTSVWLDDCVMYNKKGRWGGGGEVFGNRYVAYVTGGMTTEMDNGPAAVLLRSHRIVKITSDAFTGARTAINCNVEDIDPGATGAHPDFHQSYVADPAQFNSVILYNCSGRRCVSQGFFGHNLRDSAFVNCLFEKHNTVMYSQYGGPLDHVLFFHLTVPNQTWLWRGGFKGNNCYVVNCLLATMRAVEGSTMDGVTVRSTHFIDQKAAHGDRATSGDPLLADAASGNYRLAPESPAFRTGEKLQCVPADIEGVPYGDTPNRGCYAHKGGTDADPFH